MGIKDFLLNEKVSKSEIDKALKSTNIQIGAEFEFTVPKFEEKNRELIDKIDELEEMEAQQIEYEEEFDAWMAIDNNKEPMPLPPQWALNAGYEIGEEVPPVDEIFPEVRYDVDKVFRQLIKKFINLETLPFKNMIVSSDAKTKSAKKWVIKPDGSLGLSGVEIVTPILPLNEFLQITPKVFEWINNIQGDIDDKCGFHISMSLKNVKNLGQSLDITKLSLFMDEGYIYNFFKMREFNSYARSAHDTISRSYINMNAPKLTAKLVDEQSLEKEYPSDHYMAINIEHLNSANEYIEFRYLGGANYHRKWDKIKSVIAHYVYDLSLACDPTYKKKEYEHKMVRLLNKIELFSVCTEMTEMLQDETLDRKDPDVRKQWKSLWETWKSLYQYKEAIDADKETAHGRKGFLRMCAMLGIEENEIIWDFSRNKILT